VGGHRIELWTSCL